MSAVDFTTRRELPSMTLADMDRLYPPLPAGLSPMDDEALWEGLFMGLGFEDIAVRRGIKAEKMRARFFAFRDATGGGPITLTHQERWLTLARKRAEKIKINQRKDK